MNWLKRNIPNAFTLGNLTLGVLGIYFLLTNPSQYADKIHYFVFIAAFFDLLDGLVARLLKVQSPLGAQLDSLADLITFGVLPGFIYLNYTNAETFGFLVLLIPVCSAIRLGVFNLDDSQKTVFKGISTTAHGIFAATIPFLFHHTEGAFSQIFYGNTIALVALSWFFSFLLVSKLRMISFKFEGFGISTNWDRYLLILGSIALVAMFGLAGSPYIMLLYILLSTIGHFKSSAHS